MISKLKKEEEIIKQGCGKMKPIQTKVYHCGDKIEMAKFNRKTYCRDCKIKLKQNQKHQQMFKKFVENDLKQICYGKVDWFKVFKDAYNSRESSWWGLGHIAEWRNATDEVLFAFWKQFKNEINKLLEEK